MRKILFLFLFVFSFDMLLAQNRGDATYQFTEIPVSARIMALGGNLITVKDNDPTLGADNPALLNPLMDNQLALSYINYFAGINYGYTSYTKSYDGIGTLNGGIRFVSYGNFSETDEAGNELGSFSAGEYEITIGWGRSLDSSFSVGANFKTIYSNLYANYAAVALAVDLATTYSIPQQRFTASFVVKNIGKEVVSYQKGKTGRLPFEVQAGVSKQLQNMPVRFSLIAHHLNKANLRYDSPLSQQGASNFELSDADNTKKENTFAGNIFQHLILNAEFIPSKNFNVRLGYNFNTRKEMTVDARPATVGFSWGLGFRVSKFHISYGRSAYHLAGSPNHFTVVTNLSDFSRKQ